MGDGIKDKTLGYQDPGAAVLEYDNWDWEDKKDAYYARLFEHEGGEVDSSLDKGGYTKYGISTTQFPNVDIKGLDQAGARKIYERPGAQGGELKNAAYNYGKTEFAFKMADIGINAGPKVATEIMQKALNTFHGVDIKEDGDMGDITREYYNHVIADPSARIKLMNQIIHYQERYYSGDEFTTKTISKERVDEFGKGWMERAKYKGGQ